jgi:peptidoglycan/xylan/chitin deacetylase (PgdA/CDA1 family)
MSLRKKIRRPIQAVLRGFHHTFCSRPLPEKLGLYFHSLDDAELPAFAEAMRWAKSEGYAFTSPESFLTVPGRAVYVSFDDNHVEWYKALPLMEELGVRCTFFLNTCVLRGECTAEEWAAYSLKVKYFGPGQPLSRDEIRAMADAGHWIGAHTHSHHALPYFSDEVIEADLRRNRDMLEEITGRAVTDFAFPFGMPRYFPRRLLPLVQGLGFRTVSCATAGMQFAQGSPYALQRSQWVCARDLAWNVRNLRVNGKLFVKLTGLSPVG